MAKSGPIRILTAVPICDGHDSAINTINIEFVRSGIEVIYLGYHRSVQDIVRAAIQEEVQAIGISTYNGGHVEFFSEVVAGLRKRRASHIRVFGGGGGTITPADAEIMAGNGVHRIFFAGTPLEEITRWIKDEYGKNAKSRMTRPELPAWSAVMAKEKPGKPRIIGVAGPGGAGKTTLIDELVLRFLKNRPSGRAAILSHDPSLGAGALLGDRATMIYSQHDRVFMRSLATRGFPGGLAPETGAWLKLLKRAGFDLILLETVGVGQEAVPFARIQVDKTVFVLPPSYGSRLQLQKIALLDLADIIVINKADQAGAKTAYNELRYRLSNGASKQEILSTIASQHRNSGVDALFTRIIS